MAVIDVAGSVTGSGGISGTVLLRHLFGASFGGTGTVSGAAQRVLVFSGSPSGSASITDQFLFKASGSFSGTATVTGNATRIRSVGGYSFGSGAFKVSLPEPIQGIGTLLGLIEVTCVPPPVCPPTPRTTVRWSQVLGNGDLVLCLTDKRGNPVGPVFIGYTLFQVVRGCQLHQVGCSDRRPATAKLGTYYVTGTAGEEGQPGSWVIRWRFRRSFAEPIVEQDFCFRVVDAVLCPVPGDTLCRVCKYGWGE